MAAEPADDIRFEARLRKDIPDRLACPGGARCRPDADMLRVRLGEAVYAVFHRPLAGRDRGPEHRAQDRLQRRDIAHNACSDKFIQRRHEAGVHQPVAIFQSAPSHPISKTFFASRSLIEMPYQGRTKSRTTFEKQTLRKSPQHRVSSMTGILYH